VYKDASNKDKEARLAQVFVVSFVSFLSVLAVDGQLFEFLFVLGVADLH
jgi:hypothetical protein